MMDDPEVIASEAIIDNGRFGQRTVRFETGLLAQQAAGSALAYLDDETTVLSATTVGKNPRDQFDFFPLTVDVEERGRTHPRKLLPAGRTPRHGSDSRSAPNRPSVAPLIRKRAA